MNQGKKIYFASDFHLGVSGKLSSKKRESLLVQWMDEISLDASHLFLVGDVFDFWFDYKYVVPKGHIRLLGKIAELKDKGIDIRFFTGNHDMWMKSYFKDELDIPIYHEPIIEELFGQIFFIGHGDGLGPGDHGYKTLKHVFRNPLAQFLFKWLHPDIGMALAHFFSNKSRYSQNLVQQYLGDKEEWLIQFVEEEYTHTKPDFFIFGHRHLPIDYTLKNGKSRYINLGDWLSFQSFAVFDGQKLELKFYKNENASIFS